MKTCLRGGARVSLNTKKKKIFLRRPSGRISSTKKKGGEKEESKEAKKANDVSEKEGGSFLPNEECY